MSKKILRIATRGSDLALWQANFVKQQLEQRHSELEVELVILKTQGDKILDVPLAKVGGKGLFVKELETAILEGQADIAVHSMKDVPMEFPEGLGLAIICEREDPTDAFVSNKYQRLEDLPNNAVVGTSSLRRQCHIKTLGPDLEIQFLRGNVNTRLRKLDEGQYDAIILASAGLKRLGMVERIAQSLSLENSLPAVGQGAVGVECRTNDRDTANLLGSLHHTNTAWCVGAERAMNATLQGGCQVPIAGHAILQPNRQLYLRGIVADPYSDTVLRAEGRASFTSAEQLGTAVGKDLLAQGADKILQKVYGENGPT